METSSESESRSVVSYSLWPQGLYTFHGIIQAKILEWVAFPFSRGSSQPRDLTQISHIAGGLFTSWATRKAQEYWSEWPITSPGDIPDPGIKQGSPGFQADSLPTELWRKPLILQAIGKTEILMGDMAWNYQLSNTRWNQKQGNSTNTFRGMLHKKI